MAKREKAVDKGIEEVKKLIKQKKVVIGSERALKSLRQNKLAKVMLAVNCKKETLETVMHYAKINQAEVVTLKYPNDELGVLCKKPFSISVLGIIR
jgi:large subunit ribosomal protein L30e